MKNSCLLLPRTALVAFISALALATPITSHADSTSTLQPLADKKPALPVTTAIEKGTPGENGGPYALVVKNTSKSALKASATIVWSVTAHNRAKTVTLPAHTIEPGATWAINDLAAEDRVTLSADGFEKLEVKVHPGMAGK